MDVSTSRRQYLTVKVFDGQYILSCFIVFDKMRSVIVVRLLLEQQANLISDIKHYQIVFLVVVSQ